MARRVGRYEITEDIGKGEFGSVYKAFDPGVNREFAIIANPVDANGIARCRSKAIPAGNLHHKNIFEIYEFGKGAGTFFLLLEHEVDNAQLLSRRVRRLDSLNVKPVDLRNEVRTLVLRKKEWRKTEWPKVEALLRRADEEQVLRRFQQAE